jgi:hypothetical protein
MKSVAVILPFIAFLVFNSNSVSLNNTLVKNDTYSLEQNKTCETCLVLVNLIDHEVQLGNKTITDITNMIDDICHIVGGPVGKECSFIVKEIKNITNFISKGFNNTQICDKLHLCNNTLSKGIL